MIDSLFGKGLFYILDFMLCDEMKFAKDYRMVIQKVAKQADQVTLDDDTDESYNNNNNNRNNKNNTNRKVWTYSVGLWCLNPAVAFAPILSKARCVILTSGKLIDWLVDWLIDWLPSYS